MRGAGRPSAQRPRVQVAEEPEEKAADRLLFSFLVLLSKLLRERGFARLSAPAKTLGRIWGECACLLGSEEPGGCGSWTGTARKAGDEAANSVLGKTGNPQKAAESALGPTLHAAQHGEAGAGGLPRVQGQPGLRREPAQKMVIHGRQPAPLSLDLTRARAAPGPLACPAVSSRMRVPVHRCFLVASTQQSCGAPTVSPSPGHTHAHLRHPHSWVWLTAAQVFGLLFASCPPEELVAHWKAAKTAKRPPGSAAVRFLTEDLPLKVRGPPVLRGPWTWAALGELSHMTQQGQHRRVPCVVKSDWAVVRDGRWDIR